MAIANVASLIVAFHLHFGALPDEKTDLRFIYIYIYIFIYLFI
jgi:hypothetical protein